MMSFLISDIQFTFVNVRPVCGRLVRLESMNCYTEGEECQDRLRKSIYIYIYIYMCSKKNYVLYIWVGYSIPDHH